MGRSGILKKAWTLNLDASNLKKYIYENDKIQDVLEDIGCKHIKYHSSGDYYSCSNCDGDNKGAINVYNNEYLGVVNYTRQILDTSKSNRGADLLDLVCYNKNIEFIECLKYLSDLLELDYYYDFESDIPQSLIITQMVLNMNLNSEIEDEQPLTRVDDAILSYYKSYVNDLFYKDNISYSTQQEFGIGYDEYTNRITIPIYSEIGDLVGVKGRLFKEKLNDDDLKYIYLEPTPRYAILFGLNKTIKWIKQTGIVYLVESEKGVMQLYSYGYKNCVASGGKRVTRKQATLLNRLGVKIVICFDKDVDREFINNMQDLFIDNDNVYYIYDTNNILDEKESPCDNPEKWERLKNENIYKLI